MLILIRIVPLKGNIVLLTGTLKNALSQPKLVPFKCNQSFQVYNDATLNFRVKDKKTFELYTVIDDFARREK